MGNTFFEDDEILSFVRREMRGVRLSDERPRLRSSDSKSTGSRPSINMLMESMKLSESRPVRPLSSEGRARKRRNRSIKQHLFETFLVGFSDEPPTKMYQSNVMI